YGRGWREGLRSGHHRNTGKHPGRCYRRLDYWRRRDAGGATYFKFVYGQYRIRHHDPGAAFQTYRFDGQRRQGMTRDVAIDNSVVRKSGHRSQHWVVAQREWIVFAILMSIAWTVPLVAG